MFYSPQHAQTVTSSPTRRRIAGVAVAGATAAVGSVATAQSASASPANGGVWDQVAECESGGDWSISTGNGFYGGLQFTTQTWQGFGGDKYAPNADQATREQQIEIAQEVLKVQGPGAWPVCSQKAGLTEANGMTGGGSPAPAEQEAPQQEEAPAQAQERPAEQGASRSEARTDTGTGTGSLAVDGILGPNTHTAIEKWVGGSVDEGNTNLSPQDIRLVQANVGADWTGVLDTQTITALQEHVGANADGVWGSETTSALQTHLNAQGL